MGLKTFKLLEIVSELVSELAEEGDASADVGLGAQWAVQENGTQEPQDLVPKQCDYK